MSLTGSYGATNQAQPTTALNDNVKKLRQQLTNIHKLLNQAQTATEITFEERRDKEAASDISAMAVHQVKTQYKSENERLNAENAELHRRVQELTEQNSRLKTELTDCRHTTEQTQGEFEELKKTYQTVSSNYKALIDENAATQSQQKQDKERYTQEVNVYMQQLQQQRQAVVNLQEDISNHEAQIRKLEDINAKLREKADRYNPAEIEDANIEIDRATKTVEALTGVIEDLKKKLVEQRTTHMETVASLRTTIAAMQEELFGDDVDDAERIPRAELERRIVELTEQNELLTTNVRDLTEQLRKYGDLQKQSIMSQINPAYADANTMLGSMSLYNRPAGLPAAIPAKKDENIEDIINQSRRK